MTKDSGLRVKRDDGTIAVIPHAIIDTIPSLVAIGLYVRLVAVPDGLTEHDIATKSHPDDDPSETRVALTDLTNMGLIVCADTPRGPLHTAVNVEVIA